LFHWLDYPERERELAIVKRRMPEASAALTEQICLFVDRLRHEPYSRAPDIAKSVEWAKALMVLNTLALDPETVADTAGFLFKQRDDIAQLTQEKITELLAA
jgi:MoxR-like ATPase